MRQVHRFSAAGLLLFLLMPGYAQFSKSENGHFIRKDNKPFFWLGDTAWELFHRLGREDADTYLKRRAEQGFTVVQAVALAELDGLHTPNVYGDLPLADDDPEKPNEKYFRHVDYIIDRAASYQINIALLPTWGDKVFKDRWGTGPEIFNEKNAAAYAGWLAERYRNKTNIIWLLGGDRNPRHAKDISIWNAMAAAIMEKTNGKAMISFHPQPNELGAAEWFRDQQWLTFNMFQTGHCRETAVYDKIRASYNSKPVRPVIDGEPIYEDHPVCFNARDLGTSNAYDVRRSAYLDLLAGAFGHTYGCHDVWQMYSARYEGVNGPHMHWQAALELPGANQMQYVRQLMESFSFSDRVPDQSLIRENNYDASVRVQAARGKDYVLVYTAAGKSFTVLLEKMKARQLNAYWFDPRNGKKTVLDPVVNKGSRKFTPPSNGYGQDWILVLYR